jgi:formylglycine-generating enzyme required for sulfatase activity
MIIATPSSSRFRLPVSKEWEMAARYRRSDTTNTVQDTIYGTDFSNPADGIFWTRGDSASGAADLHSNSDASSEVAWYGNSCPWAPREVFFSGF